MRKWICHRMVTRPAIVATWAVLLSCVAARLAAGEPHPFDRRPQPWKRRDQPILSATTTTQAWCKVVLYSPFVLHHDGKFRMWYLGTSTGTRTNDIVMGYAESADGLQWTEHAGDPILTGDDIPWGRIIQTPFVLFDEEETVYKMWFVSGSGAERDDQGRVVRMSQHLGYATSRDGVNWKIHPRPIYETGRSPSVMKESANKYRMWMGSRPGPDAPWDSLYQNIYEFASVDGIHWTRGPKPVLQPSGKIRSTVYPFVLKENGRYVMWYGGHVAGGRFELFCATSSDGSRWNVDHEQPAFPAADGTTAFDSRYTSTPCVLDLPGRYLLYYSARDWQREYIDNRGRKRRDGASPYAHIGAAVMQKPTRAE